MAMNIKEYAYSTLGYDLHEIEERVLDMPEEQLTHIKSAFAKYDKKRNGQIRPKYLVKVMRELGQNPSENELNTILNHLLVDGKKKINFIDVVQVIIMFTSDIDELFLEVFKLFDTDGDGKISKEEFFEQVLKCGVCITPDEVREIIEGADKDGDGEIDLIELANMLKGKDLATSVYDRTIEEKSGSGRKRESSR